MRKYRVKAKEVICQFYLLKLLYTIILLFCVDCLSIQSVYSQQISKNNYTGNWTSTSSWTTSNWNSTTPATTNISQNVTVNGYITSNASISFNGSGGNLIVNDTLVINGNLTLGSNNNITVNNNAVLIVKGNLSAGNQTAIAADAYIIVTGNFTKSGSGSQGSFTSNDTPSKVFIGGTVQSGLSTTSFPVLTNCTAGTYPNTCGYGNLTNLANDPISSFLNTTCTAAKSPTWNSNGKPSSNSGAVTVGQTISLSQNAIPDPSWSTTASYSWSGPSYTSTSQYPTVTTSATLANTGYYVGKVINGYGCSIKDSTYVLVSSCCGGSSYYSRDNYSGLWSNAQSWGTNNVSNTLPPPSDGTGSASNSICISGTITVNGNLTLTGGNKTICDTLIVTGNLDASSTVLTISSTGVLIVLGAFTGGSGNFNNNSKVVIAGTATIPWSFSYAGNNEELFLFNPGTVQGSDVSITGTTLASLQTKDPSLYATYISVACSGGINAGTISGDQSFCGSGDVALLIETLAATTGSSYQWYSTTDGIVVNPRTWTAIASATSTTYNPPVVSTSTYFIRKATSGVCTANSNEVTITIKSIPSASIAVSGLSSSYKCVGDNLNLTGSYSPLGGTSVIYDWYVPGNAISVQTGTSNTFSKTNLQISNSGNYSLVVTRDGCQSSQTSNAITVTNGPSPSVYTVPNHF